MFIVHRDTELIGMGILNEREDTLFMHSLDRMMRNSDCVSFLSL